jgi:hypothetical protein
MAIPVAPNRDAIGPAGRPLPSRRAWLAGSLIAGAGWLARGAELQGAATPAETVEAIQREARQAGLGPFETAETKNFLGIGDGPGPYRQSALDICQELATVYLKHFRDKGFSALALPERRLAVVTLKDRTSYEKFLGESAGPDVGGHFDLDANRLVIYDFRPPVNEPVANAMRVNTFTLIHEGLHLLTFNTGLLNRGGDVPLCVSEGLAAYGEAWRPSVRTPFGLHHAYRREELAKADLATVWITAGKLIARDGLLEDGETAQLGYAQSWLLVHYLMRTPARLRGFRAYLAAITHRKDASHRLDDAAAHLGDLDRLDRDLKKHARRVLEER